MFRADLVLAGCTGFLVQLAAGRVRGLAAIGRRHFLLHALAEGGAGLTLAFLVSHLAGFTLLRIAGLGAVEILPLFLHALFALRAGGVLAGFARLVACFAVGRAGGRVGRQAAIAGCAGARAACAW